MKRFPFIAASAAVGLALLAGAAHTLQASSANVVPPGHENCYYHLWTCSYEGNNYWSGCDPNYGEGWISTEVAQSICTTYHEN